MTEASIIQSALQLGVAGPFMGFLIWDRLRAERRADAEEARQAAQAERRIEADKTLASSVAALATTCGFQHHRDHHSTIIAISVPT